MSFEVYDLEQILGIQMYVLVLNPEILWYLEISSYVFFHLLSHAIGYDSLLLLKVQMAIALLLLLLASIFLHVREVFLLEEYLSWLLLQLFHFDGELLLHKMLLFDLQS